jgi:hypothetical protein
LEAARDALDDIVFFATDPQMTQWAVTCAARVRDSITEVLR